MSSEAKAKQDSKRWGRKHTKQACDKIRKARTGVSPSEETRQKQRLASLGRKDSSETRLRRSLAKRGIPFSEEHKKSLSAARLNKIASKNTSGFVGVSLNPRSKKWQAMITLPGGKRKNCGEFWKLEDAVFVQHLAMFKFHGKDR